MAPGDGPFGGSIDVPFSNAALFVVSVCGFSMLAVTLYKVIIVRLKTSEELENDIDGDTDYEERLKRSDVSTLTRAERRARAHAIMKDKRRAPQQPMDGEAADDSIANAGSKLTRKEREKVAKTQEKAERKLYEKERLEQQRLAQAAAQREKEDRDAEVAKRRQEEATRLKLEMEARERDALQEWNTFMSTPTRSLSVHDWIAQVKRQRYIAVTDVANDFEASTEAVLERINGLLREGRITGLIDNDEHFLFLDDKEMLAIASAVTARGSVSLSDIADIVEEVAFRET